MKHIRIFLVGLAVLLAVAGAAAAEEEKPAPDDSLVIIKNDRGGALYFLAGNRTMEINSLNSSLTGAGYPSIDKNFISFGLGGHAILNNLILGMEVHTLSRKQAGAGAWNISASGNYMLFNAGWVVKRTPTYILYPQAGIGYGTFTLDITSAAPATFGQVLASPAQGSTLTRGSAVFNIAFAADGFQPLGSTAGGTELPFVFGFRAGYLFSTAAEGWKSPAGAIGGGPDAPFTGLYLEIIVGIGFLG